MSIQERVYSANEYADAQDRITELEQRNENNLAGWRDNVAGLSRHIAKLEAENEQLHKAGADAAGDAVVLHKACDQLEAEVERLKAQAGRQLTWFKDVMRKAAGLLTQVRDMDAIAAYNCIDLALHNLAIREKQQLAAREKKP